MICNPEFASPVRPVDADPRPLRFDPVIKSGPFAVGDQVMFANPFALGFPAAGRLTALLGDGSGIVRVPRPRPDAPDFLRIDMDTITQAMRVGR